MMTLHKIEQRNEWLLNFFTTLFPGKIIIANTLDNPAVIYNEVTCLSCFVQNFELKFMDKSRDGKKVYSLFLQEKITDYDTERIMDWFSNSEHRRIFRIKLAVDMPVLYLSGYNYRNKKKGEGKYPVFSRHNPKIYMTRQNAQLICDEFKPDKYDLIIV